MKPFPVLVIGGPTAGGKSGLAMKIAAEMPAMVINADSLQLYRGLPILTAQPSPDDRAAAPHVLYEVFGPHDTASAALWRTQALVAMAQAHDMGRLPILVGGTGFYLKALLEGLSPMPEVAPEFRAQATALQQKLGNPGFHAALQARDPETAARLDPWNTQRNIRAWEVLEATGRPLAHWQDAPRQGPPAHLQFLTVILSPVREVLYKRCDERFEEMLHQGALDEVRAFQASCLAPSPLTKALGYQELAAVLAGTFSLAEARTQAQQSTRHYAKRQVTWFRHQLKYDLWLESQDPEPILRQLAL